MDAFGRLRTSQAYTMFDYYPNSSTSATNNDIDIWVTTGSCIYNVDNYLALTCAAGSGSVTRQTKQKMFYQAGKSRLLYFSAVMNDSGYSTGNVTTNVGILMVQLTKGYSLGMKMVYCKCYCTNFMEC